MVRRFYIRRHPTIDTSGGDLTILQQLSIIVYSYNKEVTIMEKEVMAFMLMAATMADSITFSDLSNFSLMIIELITLVIIIIRGGGGDSNNGIGISK